MDHASRSAFLFPRRRLRSGPVVEREFATSSKIRLLSFRWRPPALYRCFVRLDGGHAAAHDDCAEVSIAIDRGLSGSSYAEHHTSTEEWNHNDGGEKIRDFSLDAALTAAATL